MEAQDKYKKNNRHLRDYFMENSWFRYAVRLSGIFLGSLLFFSDKPGSLLWILSLLGGILFSMLLANIFFMLFSGRMSIKNIAGIAIFILLLASVYVLYFYLPFISDDYANLSAAEPALPEPSDNASNSEITVGEGISQLLFGFKESILLFVYFTFVLYLGAPAIPERKRKKAFEHKIIISNKKYPSNSCEFGEACYFAGQCYVNDSFIKYNVYVNCELDENDRKTRSHLFLTCGEDKKHIILEEDVKQLGWAYSRNIDKFIWFDIDYYVVLRTEREEIGLRFCGWNSKSKVNSGNSCQREDKASAYYYFIALIFAINGISKDSPDKIEDKCSIINMQEKLGLTVQTDLVHAVAGQMVAEQC